MSETTCIRCADTIPTGTRAYTSEGGTYPLCPRCHVVESTFAKHADRDPDGIAPHAPGAKLDAEKPRAGLVLGSFSRALTEVARVGTYGARKYSDNGWESVRDGEARYTDAMLRHWLLSRTEEVDQESGLLHLAQVCWNNLAALELHLRHKEDA